VAAHISSCSACEAVLGTLPEDPLSAGLRGARALPEEPELLRLERLARDLIPREGEPTAAEERTHARVDAAAHDLRGLEFGPYQLLGEPIYGGMGVVWRARHRVLNVVRALKMLPAGSAAEPDVVTRFCVEGEATARLNHPHIVRVHEFGWHDGRLYYAMDFLDGGTLAQRLKSRPMPAEEAASLVAILARAVEHAHRQGVVHRDLKPSNILFSDDGTPALTDFGLAKMVDEKSIVQTQTNAALGTPTYMSPEQAAGGSRQAAPAMDVWALGAILYECLTGQPAFKGRNTGETIQRVRRANPQLPSSLCQGLDRQLEAVCLKCLEKKPSRRYASAADLADDLERWRSKARTRVRPPGLLARALQAVRQRPRQTAAVAALVLLLATAAGAYYITDPYRIDREYARRWARGEPVTLIGTSGEPTWSEWVIGKPRGSAYLDVHETFTLSSAKDSYLELVREPPRAPYWFEARVCHRSGPHGSKVGLYFVRGHTGHRAGTVHWLYTLGFNDSQSEVAHFDAQLAPRLRAKAPAVRPAGNRVMLEPRLCGENERGLFINDSVGNRTAQTFHPRGDAWRSLAVEVAPEGVRAFWEGEKIAEFSAQDMDKDAQALEPVLGQGGRAGARPNERRINFDSRGSLGLFVICAAASFREVVVKPLGAGH
jgi:serine/threonine-protein kinase